MEGKETDFRSAKDATQLLAFYALGVFVFFELIATKYTTYTFPALFSMAILTAILYQNISFASRKQRLAHSSYSLPSPSWLRLPSC